MAFASYPPAGTRLTAATLQGLIAELRPLYVRKGSDESVISSTTLQDDNELVLAMVANASYKMRLRVIVNSGTTPDVKFGFTVPSGTTMSVHYFEGSTPSAAASVLQGPGTEATVPAFSTVAADQIIMIEGLVIVSSTAGNLQVQWAQNVSNATNTTVKANSYLQLDRVS